MLGRDVQDVGNDLRDRGLVSLTLRNGADGDDDFAVDVELGAGGLRIAGERRLRIDDLRLAEIVGAGIERGADADAEPAAFGVSLGALGLPLVPADQIFRHLQHAGIVAGIVDAAVRRGVGKLFRPNVIAQAHLVGGNVQLVSADVEHALQEPQVLHARIAAIGADGTFVGDDLA